MNRFLSAVLTISFFFSILCQVFNIRDVFKLVVKVQGFGVNVVS